MNKKTRIFDLLYKLIGWTVIGLLGFGIAFGIYAYFQFIHGYLGLPNSVRSVGMEYEVMKSTIEDESVGMILRPEFYSQLGNRVFLLGNSDFLSSTGELYQAQYRLAPIIVHENKMQRYTIFSGFTHEDIDNERWKVLMSPTMYTHLAVDIL